MKKILLAALAIMMLASCASKFDRSHYVVAYYPSYKAASATAALSDEILRKITHINLSFATVNADGTINDANVRESYACFADDAHRNGVKILVSVGGGGGHDQQVSFAAAIHDEAARASLIDNLMKLADDLGLDGLDIDYEAWGLQDTAYDMELEADLEALLRGLRARLGDKRWLTGAVACYGRYNGSMAEVMDYITVMAYDLTGPWGSVAGPHSPMDFFVKAMDMFGDYGFPKDKMVGGVPFYGYGFPKDAPAYALTYADIIKTYPGAENYSCVNEELWYDGMPAIAEKCQYVLDNGYAGIMFWELTGDSKDPETSLLFLIDKMLNQPAE